MPSQELPKIAVLMAVYNGMRWLTQQVDSILNQEAVKVTLYISVDQSQDNSALWCQELADSDNRVVLLPLGQRYGSATKNFFRLLQEVDFKNFDYTSFADQDDIWHSDKLHRAVNILKSQGYSGYSSNVTAWWDGKSSKKRLLNKAQPMKKWDYLFESGGPGCTYVMSQSLIIDIQKCLLALPELVGKLDFHDWFCYAYARGKNIQWHIDNEPSMLYRQHGDNAVGINRGIRPFLIRAKHALAGHSFEQALVIMQVIFHDRPNHIPLIIPKKRRDFFKLALKTRHCRRRHLDQFYFFCLCLVMAIYGKK
jgi:rhamnosyltransferase